MKDGLKTYKLFFAFVMVGVITTVVSFQTLHFVQNHCDQKHYCHEDEEEKADKTCSRFTEEEEDCPLCELKLPLISPVESETDEQVSFTETGLSKSLYQAPRTDSRMPVYHLRGPPSNS